MRLRNVSPKDLFFLYKLHNHPKIREVSFNKEPFTYAEHLKYWQNKIDQDTFEAKIIIADKEKIGCIRRDNKLISIAILPQYQLKGMGTQVLKNFCKKGDKAEITYNNIGAKYAFERAGFQQEFFTLIKC